MNEKIEEIKKCINDPETECARIDCCRLLIAEIERLEKENKELKQPKKQVGIDKVYIGTHACRICVEKDDGFMCDAENGIDCINNLCDKIDNMGDTIDNFVEKNKKLRRACDCAKDVLRTHADWIEKGGMDRWADHTIAIEKLQQAIKESKE